MTHIFLAYATVMLLLNGAAFASSIPKRNSSFYQLKKDLLQHYDSDLRPVSDPHVKTNVSLFMLLHQLYAVHEHSNNIVLTGLIEIYWKDEFMIWNPDDYDDIDDIRLPASKVWIPMVSLWNSTKVALNPPRGDGVVEVEHDGMMEYKVPFVIDVSCPINVRYFPWDKQDCVFAYGPTERYTKDLVMFTKYNRVDMNTTVQHPEWTVNYMMDRRVVAKVPDRNRSFTFVEYRIGISRLPLFFIYTLIIPSALIAFIAITAFFTPYNSKGERQEKCRIGLSAFTSMLVLQLNVVRDLPHSATVVPIISIYFNSLLILIALGILLGTLILYLEIQVRPVPYCLQWMVGLADWIPFVTRVKKKSDVTTISAVLHRIVAKQSQKPRSDFDASNPGFGEARLTSFGKKHSADLLRSPDLEQKDSQNLGPFINAVRTVVSNWDQVVKTVQADITKEEGKSNWQTFVNVLEKVFHFFLFLLWVTVLILLFNQGWYKGMH